NGDEAEFFRAAEERAHGFHAGGAEQFEKRRLRLHHAAVRGDEFENPETEFLEREQPAGIPKPGRLVPLTNCLRKRFPARVEADAERPLAANSLGKAIGKGRHEVPRTPLAASRANPRNCKRRYFFTVTQITSLL